MKRKKTNPNRIPISPKNYDLEKLKQQAANGKVLQTWAVLLAALSNLGGDDHRKAAEYLAADRPSPHSDLYLCRDGAGAC